MSSSQCLPRIARLSTAVASQIAAGEVIERPASVIKELVENSLDADASRIEISIERGGTQLIRVRDNGHGIHPQDLALALESHATSKLRAPADLERIISLGFRGEALSSIAAISRFSITSHIEENDEGWCLDFDPVSGESDVSPAAHPIGTSVEVAELFQSTPARRKFLRSEKTEFLHILETVKRLALSRFDVAIRLHHNGRLVLSCPAVKSDYRNRIDSVIGSAFYNDALYIDYHVGEMRLWGWLGGDKSWRSQSDRQYFYLNGRAIRDKSVNHAIRLSLQEKIPAGRYPSYLLHMEMDCAAADVNVHPTKQEVRFKRPRDVHDFIYAALRSPIGTSPEQTAFVTAAIDQESIHNRQVTQVPHRSLLKEAGTLYSIPDRDQLSRISDERRPVLGKAIACLYGRFILCERADDLILLDAIAARRFYLRYRFEKDIKAGNVKQRPLLVPLVISVPAADLKNLIEQQAVLSVVGLNVEQAGPDSIIIRSIPTLLEDVDIQALLKDLVKSLNALTSDTSMHVVLSVLTEHGTKSSLSMYSLRELERLLRSLEETDLPLLDENLPGIWQTLRIEELNSIIQSDAKR